MKYLKQKISQACCEINIDKKVGGPKATAVEPILDSLYALLANYGVLPSEVSDLNKLLKDLIKPEAITKKRFLV